VWFAGAHGGQCQVDDPPLAACAEYDVAEQDKAVGRGHEDTEELLVADSLAPTISVQSNTGGKQEGSSKTTGCASVGDPTARSPRVGPATNDPPSCASHVDSGSGAAGVEHIAEDPTGRSQLDAAACKASFVAKGSDFSFKDRNRQSQYDSWDNAIFNRGTTWADVDVQSGASSDGSDSPPEVLIVDERCHISLFRHLPDSGLASMAALIDAMPCHDQRSREHDEDIHSIMQILLDKHVTGDLPTMDRLRRLKAISGDLLGERETGAHAVHTPPFSGASPDSASRAGKHKGKGRKKNSLAFS